MAQQWIPDIGYVDVKPKTTAPSAPSAQSIISNASTKTSGPQTFQQAQSSGDTFSSNNVGMQSGVAALKNVVTNTPAVNNASAVNNTTPNDANPSLTAYNNQIANNLAYTNQMKIDNQQKQDQTTASYNMARDAKIAAVRQAIETSKGKLNTVISNAPQEFQVKKNDVSVQNNLNQTKLLDNLISMGYSQGSRLPTQLQLSANNSRDQQITQLDTAQEKTIQDAQNSIAELEAQGKTEEASTIYDYATKSLEAINNLKERLQANLTSENNNLTDNLKGMLDYTTSQRETEKRDAIAAEDKKVKDYIATLGQFNGDYKAEIDRITNDGDTSNDWQISYLKQAREGKLSDQAIAKAKAEKDAFDRSVELKKLANDTRQVDISQQNANTSAAKSSGNGSSSDKEYANFVKGIDEQAKNIVKDMKTQYKDSIYTSPNYQLSADRRQMYNAVANYVKGVGLKDSSEIANSLSKAGFTVDEINTWKW